MKKIDTNNTIWVAPAGGEEQRGTYELPYTDVGKALANAQPGQKVILRPGRYEGDTTIECSGTEHYPITVISEEPEGAEIVNGCWYFYDTSDLIISGLAFRDSPTGGLSIVGACHRNRFEKLRFRNCGGEDRTAATVLFGGSGGSCNVVEECTFHRDAQALNEQPSVENASVGLMILEGDRDGGEAIRDFVIRRNTFVNYSYGILVGARDAAEGEYGHLIEYNRVENCSAGGIMVKCGDTSVRGNTVRNIRRGGVSVVAGKASEVRDNRIMECENGIEVCGAGHTIANNCVVRSRLSGIRVSGKVRPELRAGSNIIVENNTLIERNGHRAEGASGHIAGGRDASAGVHVDAGVTCVVQNNLFCGSGKPQSIDPSGEKTTRCFARANAVCGGLSIEGWTVEEVEFAEYDNDDFDNRSGFGAQGWMVSHNAAEPDEEPAGEILWDEIDEEPEDIPERTESGVNTLIRDVDREEIVKRALFGDEE